MIALGISTFAALVALASLYFAARGCPAIRGKSKTGGMVSMIWRKWNRRGFPNSMTEDQAKAIVDEAYRREVRRDAEVEKQFRPSIGATRWVFEGSETYRRLVSEGWEPGHRKHIAGSGMVAQMVRFPMKEADDDAVWKRLLEAAKEVYRVTERNTDIHNALRDAIAEAEEAIAKGVSS